jgi:adenylate cyclase, class 2
VKTEFEARFLGIDAAAIADQLVSRSAQCTMPRTLMRRILFNNNDIQARGGWLRLRDQGERTFLAYKQVAAKESAIDSILEAEVQVSDFDATRDLGLDFTNATFGSVDAVYLAMTGRNILTETTLTFT